MPSFHQAEYTIFNPLYHCNLLTIVMELSSPQRKKAADYVFKCRLWYCCGLLDIGRSIEEKIPFVDDPHFTECFGISQSATKNIHIGKLYIIQNVSFTIGRKNFPCSSQARLRDLLKAYLCSKHILFCILCSYCSLWFCRLFNEIGISCFYYKCHLIYFGMRLNVLL